MGSIAMRAGNAKFWTYHSSFRIHHFGAGSAPIKSIPMIRPFDYRQPAMNDMRSGGQG
jgi:hypothetical protein